LRDSGLLADRKEVFEAADFIFEISNMKFFSPIMCHGHPEMPFVLAGVFAGRLP